MGQLWVAKRIADVAKSLGVDIVHAPEYLSTAVLATLDHRIPVVLTVPGNIFQRLAVPEGNQASYLYTETIKWAARASARQCSAVIAFTREMKEWWERTGSAPERTPVIPYGVDVDHFQPVADARQRLGIPHDSLMLLYVGRLDREKGLFDALKAFRQVKDEIGLDRVRFDVLGAGLLRKDLELAAAQTGLSDHVHFHGPADRTQLPDWYSAADALLLPSWIEPFGRVMLEAMACGTPVLATTTGGPIDHIVDGENGFLFPPRDPSALAAIIQTVVANPSQLKTMSPNALMYVRRHLSWKRIVERIINEVYLPILDLHPARITAPRDDGSIHSSTSGFTFDSTISTTALHSVMPGQADAGRTGEERDHIRTEGKTSCFLCQSDGVLLYSRMQDRLHSVPGEWDIYQCQRCGLCWLNPCPIPDDIPKLYAQYYTHQAIVSSSLTLIDYLRKAAFSLDAVKRLASAVLRKVPVVLLQFPSFWTEVWLNDGRQGCLLDVGSGSGSFLATMQAFGWQVCGVEPDPIAASITQRQLGLDIYAGTLEDAAYPNDTFDVITMNHVIEHLPNPARTLVECYRILRPGGRLVIQTPNSESLGHRRVFRRSWIHLDPPRHLYIFSPTALGTLAQHAGFRVEALFASSRGAGFTWLTSSVIQRYGVLPVGWRERLPRRTRVEGQLFRMLELTMSAGGRGGENLEAVAIKEVIQ